MKTTYEQALHRLAAYCSRGERCVADVLKKCELWELTEQETAEVVARLKKEKFIDETRYCHAFVNDKSRYSGWGGYKIRQALRNKRIAVELIDEALRAIDSEESIERLRCLLEQKRKTVKGENDYEIRQKLMRFAAGRGFSLEEIERALR